jgi:hypothetical protein
VSFIVIMFLLRRQNNNKPGGGGGLGEGMKWKERDLVLSQNLYAYTEENHEVSDSDPSSCKPRIDPTNFRM